MNMCADCGGVLDRGFVVVMDFKLLCAQQLAILDSEDNVRFFAFSEFHYLPQVCLSVFSCFFRH